MPRFYFDAVLQGKPEADPVGIELDNRDVARQEAVRAAAEMAKDRHVGENAQDITLAIREGDDPVATVRLCLKIEEPVYSTAREGENACGNDPPIPPRS